MTYPQARIALFSHLISLGWTVKASLKVPHASPPDGSYKVWFKPQAVYLGEHSTFLDIRALSPEAFVLRVEAMAKGD